MKQLQRLLQAAMCAGAVSGLALFALQYVTLQPLIARAETYEHSAAPAHDHHLDEHGSGSAWEPADGAERTSYTALGTVLTGIGFAAIVLGITTAADLALDARRGVWLGLAGFVVFAAAPSLGLPPRPPGVAGPDVAAAQIWWVCAAAAALAALWVVGRAPHSPIAWGSGVFLAALPHLVGAPVSPVSTLIPADVTSRFAWLSMATRLPFWLLLGAVGGHLLADRSPQRAV